MILVQLVETLNGVGDGLNNCFTGEGFFSAVRVTTCGFDLMIYSLLSLLSYLDIASISGTFLYS